MTKLVIDRQRWLRGEGGGRSMLLRPDDNKMCCLGFYCARNNLPKELIEEVTSPMELQFDRSDPPKFLTALVEMPDDGRSSYDSEICNLLMNANDAIVGQSKLVFDEPDREQQIKRLFEDIGVEVEFIN